MTPVDPAAMVVGILIIVGTLALIGWVLYLVWLGPLEGGLEDERNEPPTEI